MSIFKSRISILLFILSLILFLSSCTNKSENGFYIPENEVLSGKLSVFEAEYSVTVCKSQDAITMKLDGNDDYYYKMSLDGNGVLICSDKEYPIMKDSAVCLFMSSFCIQKENITSAEKMSSGKTPVCRLYAKVSDFDVILTLNSKTDSLIKVECPEYFSFVRDKM